jgi:hypothetical protein
MVRPAHGANPAAVVGGSAEKPVDPADVADAMNGDGEVLWSRIPGCR